MSGSANPALLFNRATKRLQRNRASSRFSEHDFLIREASIRLAERVLEDITRPFPAVLELGCRSGYLYGLLKDRAGKERWLATDMSEGMLKTCTYPATVERMVVDEEHLPFAPESFDLIVSTLNLHWVNDLPGTLAQARRLLKDGGLFVASLFGGHTLIELKQALHAADMKIKDGLAARFSPLTDTKDAGMLLQRVGFQLPVADAETITVTYAHPLQLLQDLRGMAETGALATGTSPLSKAVLEECFQVYEKNEEGGINATFDILTLTGWKS